MLLSILNFIKRIKATISVTYFFPKIVQDKLQACATMQQEATQTGDLKNYS